MATADDRRNSSVRPPGVKYPWDSWQDGRWWTITRGEGKDFEVSIRAMRDQLHVRAKTTGVKVATRTDKETQIVFSFQVPGEDDEAFALRAKTGASYATT